MATTSDFSSTYDFNLPLAKLACDFNLLSKWTKKVAGMVFSLLVLMQIFGRKMPIVAANLQLICPNWAL